MTIRGYRILTTLGVLALLLLAARGPMPASRSPASVPAPHDRPAAAQRAFDRIGAFAGTWNFRAGSDSGRVSYELVSNGTAILERVMNAEHGEAGMVSVIHVDGGRLVLQHYCGAGNQPRLVSTGLAGDEVVFTLEGVANLASPAAGHIAAARFRFPGGGRFETTWTWRALGADIVTMRRHAPIQPSSLAGTAHSGG
jgi:hypothetical protein